MFILQSFDNFKAEKMWDYKTVSFGPKKNFKFHTWVNGVIFQKSADWLDCPSPVSVALKNGLLNFFLFYIFIFQNIKPSSFGDSDPDPSSVKSIQNLVINMKYSIFKWFFSQFIIHRLSNWTENWLFLLFFVQRSFGNFWRYVGSSNVIWVMKLKV